MISDFREKVKDTIERYQMLHRGDTVIIGISGGADSVALLSVLNELKNELEISLIGAHVNHGLRGEEALRDEKFSENLCKTYGIPFYVLHEDVAKLAKEQGASFEACGRQVRYDFFEKIACEFLRENKGCGVFIATAHNANDVSETILYNLSRGTGLKGVTGIPPVRPVGSGDTSVGSDMKIKVIRPIIDCTRNEIVTYLAEKNQEYVTDSTNLDDEYARNRIRIHVLPELCKINENAIGNITRFADSVREDEEFLSSLSHDLAEKSHDDSGCYSISFFENAAAPVLKRALSEIIYSKTGVHAEKVHIDKLYKTIKSGETCKVQLPGGAYFVINDSSFFIMNSDFEKKDNLCEGKTYIVEKISIDDYKKSNIHLLENTLDYDKISGKLFFRNRKNGDHFRPYRRKINKSLKCLFNEAHVPVEKRDLLNILECDGEIVWLEGFGPAYGYQVTKETKEVLYIHVQ